MTLGKVKVPPVAMPVQLPRGQHPEAGMEAEELMVKAQQDKGRQPQALALVRAVIMTPRSAPAVEKGRRRGVIGGRREARDGEEGEEKTHRGAIARFAGTATALITSAAVVAAVPITAAFRLMASSIHRSDPRFTRSRHTIHRSSTTTRVCRSGQVESRIIIHLMVMMDDLLEDAKLARRQSPSATTERVAFVTAVAAEVVEGVKRPGEEAWVHTEGASHVSGARAKAEAPVRTGTETRMRRENRFSGAGDCCRGGCS